MAMPSRTDWSKIRYIMFILLTVNVLLASSLGSGASKKQKRQLFREHLLPQQGGKIPEGALKPERLTLNKYNQNGLFSPDGYHLDQRHPERHHLPKFYLPQTLKINIPPADDRYVAPPGRFYAPHMVDTTYLINQPVNYILMPNGYFRFDAAVPFLPEHSVKLVRHFKHQHNQQKQQQVKSNNDAWNEVSPQSDFAEKVLAELAPYLRKLQEYD